MQTPARITGRMVGVTRLNQLITALTKENAGELVGFNAYLTTKVELGIKGSRDGVLEYAREVLSGVATW